MPIQTNLRSFEVKNQLRNGLTFSGNPAEFATNFVGVVGETLQAAYEIDLGWFASANLGDSWQVEALAIERTAGDFRVDGFEVGQTFEFFSNWATYNNASEEFSATITAITLNGRRIEFSVLVGTVPVGTTTIAGIQAQANLVANIPDAAILRFNLLPNGQTFSDVSELTGTSQAWYAGNIDIAGGAAATMAPIGVNQGWKTGEATIQRTGLNLAKNNVTFTIVHSFQVGPFYEISYLANLQNGTTPTFWQDELNYYFQVEFRDGLNNTNSAKIAQPARPLGSSGWYNQSPNGFYSRYTLASGPTHTDTTTASAVDSVQVDARTTTTFTLSRLAVLGSAAGFNASESAFVYIAYLPNSQVEYQQTPTDLATNFVFDQIAGTDGLPATVGAGVFKSCEVSVSGGIMTVTVETEYSSAEQIQIGAGSKYLMWVMVGDTTLAVNSTDRTPVLVETNDYTRQTFIPNLASFTRFNTLTHAEDLGVDTGATEAETVSQFSEDGILVDFEFDLDTSKNAQVTGLTFVLAAYRASDENYFPLDTYEYNLSGAVISGSTQQINVDDTRGYILAQGDQFNLVRANTGALAGVLQAYTGAFAQKIKWQDWLLNPAVDTVFYDTNEPNNGLNFKAENYSGVNSYQVRMLAILDLTGTDANGIAGIGRVVRVGAILDLFDYGVSTDGNWGGTIFTLDPDTGTDLGGAIRTDKDTLFRTVWTNPSTSLTDVYGIHRIQAFNSLGDDIEELSTLRTPAASGNLLKPLTGLSLLDLSVVGSDIHTECLIDHTQVNPSQTYNLSARIERGIAAPNFTVAFVVCDVQLTNTFTGGTITDIEYQFSLGATVIDTVNTLLTVYTWDPAALYAGETISIQQTVTSSAGTFVTSENVVFPAFASCFVSFTSNLDGAETFDPSVASSAGNPFWRLPDDSFIQASIVSVLGSTVGFDGTNKQIFLTPEGTFSEISGIQLDDDALVGSLDLTNTVTIGPNFRADNNPDLTGVTFPSTAETLATLFVNSCGLLGTLDFSPISNLAGQVQFNNNPALTGVTFPSSAGAVTAIRGADCDLTGTVDLSVLSGLQSAIELSNNLNLTAVNFPTNANVFTVIYIQNTAVSSLDFSTITGIASDLRCDSNPNLTTVTFPSNANSFTNFRFQLCNLTGVVDVSGLTGIGGDFRVNNNPNLTGLTFGASSTVFSAFRASSCNFTGTLNLSTLSNLGGAIELHLNSNLTQVSFPTSAQTVFAMRVYQCNITGTLDFSGMTAIQNEIRVNNNPLMTGLTLPASSGTISIFRAENCDLGYFDVTGLTFSASVDFDAFQNAMTAAEVNQILVDLDATLPLVGTGSVDIAGNNAAPDTTSGGFNGVAAAASLAGKGYTVVTS